MAKKLTEEQFHTVWSEAVGRLAYNKKLFREVLNALTKKGLIVEDSELETMSHDEIADLFLKRT